MNDAFSQLFQNTFELAKNGDTEAQSYLKVLEMAQNGDTEARQYIELVEAAKRGDSDAQKSLNFLSKIKNEPQNFLSHGWELLNNLTEPTMDRIRNAIDELKRKGTAGLPNDDMLRALKLLK
jgi:hypothetical protein